MNRTDLPVWLLDVDGVINAFPTIRQPGSWRRNQWTRFKVRGFHIQAARPVLDFIRKVHEEGLAEIRWHTTWQEKALDLGDVLGLPTFHIAAAPEFDDRPDNVPHLGYWWKAAAAYRVVDVEKRRLLWTDDDATELDDYDNRRIWAGGPGTAMVIAPDPSDGLVQTDLDRIQLFLTNNLATKEVSLP